MYNLRRQMLHAIRWSKNWSGRDTGMRVPRCSPEEEFIEVEISISSGKSDLIRVRTQIKFRKPLDFSPRRWYQPAQAFGGDASPVILSFEDYKQKIKLGEVIQLAFHRE